MTEGGRVDIYRLGDFMLDSRRRELFGGSERIHLPPKEFQALILLLDAAGNALEKEKLVQALWPDTAVGDTSLARVISALRRRLGTDAIETVPKFGYRLALPVLPVETAAEAPEMASKQELDSTGHEPPRRRGGKWAPGVAIAGFAISLAVFWVLRLLDHAPTWTDPQTHLTWARQDNGRDVSRAAAIAYCQSLALDGRKGWRLATIAELQTLYDPSISQAGVWGRGSKHPRPVYWHIKGGILPTGGATASDLTFDGTQEQSFDFSYGRRNFDPPEFYADHRALCVAQ